MQHIRCSYVLASVVGCVFAGAAGAAPPKAPEDPKAIATSNTTVDLSWKADGYGADVKIAVWRADKEKAKWKDEWKEVGKVAAKDGKFTDKPPKEFTDYWYGLQSVEGGEESDLSKVAEKVHTGLPKPTDLTVAPGPGYVTLTWKHPGPAAKFELERRAGNSGKFEPAGEPEASPFNDPEAPQNSFAAYRIRAKSADGKLMSDFTAEAATRTFADDWHLNAAALHDNRYDPETVNRIVYCTFKPPDAEGPARWRCDPANAVYLSADEVSTIVLRNLPPGVKRVTATLASGPDGRTSGQKPNSRVFDEIVFGTQSNPSTVAIDLYKLRRLNPTFSKDTWVGESEVESAVADLRAQNRSGEEEIKDHTGVVSSWKDRASLVARSEDSVVLISLSNDANQTMSLPPIELVYQRWWIDLGGFYAFRQLSDEELISAPVPSEGTSSPAKVQVLRVSDGHDWESDTGVMTTFFPANYPMMGASFGIAENSGRSLSYYLGGAIRLRGKRGAAAATIAFGLCMAPVRRYPGINTKDGDLNAPIAEGADYVYDATSPLLNGEVKNELRPFAAITLGFALDRRSAKSGPKD